ncbi:hypothetical protein AXG93_2167s1090 [Marchantia polymorpha subsp. ruderalis]|uniref:Uncharacterized protein n=1 Tax=Marchantia polymorpha subsp. ruderalis TaxID=1480154 RepID=A0A176W428_MARPO|nr:hypothetical protein AXG93_2167s1090 [Marchantia polymorpha subsp. ruderalis]
MHVIYHAEVTYEDDPIRQENVRSSGYVVEGTGRPSERTWEERLPPAPLPSSPPRDWELLQRTEILLTACVMTEKENFHPLRCRHSVLHRRGCESMGTGDMMRADIKAWLENSQPFESHPARAKLLAPKRQVRGCLRVTTRPVVGLAVRVTNFKNPFALLYKIVLGGQWTPPGACRDDPPLTEFDIAQLFYELKGMYEV